MADICGFRSAMMGETSLAKCWACIQAMLFTFNLMVATSRVDKPESRPKPLPAVAEGQSLRGIGQAAQSPPGDGWRRFFIQAGVITNTEIRDNSI